LPHRNFIVRLSETGGIEAPADLTLDTGIVERFNQTVLDEFYRRVPQADPWIDRPIWADFNFLPFRAPAKVKTIAV
jgi:hypothetical protein